jgi:hypothetical protein
MAVRPVVFNRLAVALAAVLSGSATARAELLVVDVRTDYVPLTEFTQVAVSVRSQTDPSFLRSTDFFVPPDPSSLDFSTGVRVAEIGDLPPGVYRVDVSLILPFSCADLPPRIYPPGTVVATPPRVTGTGLAIVPLDGNRVQAVYVPRSPAIGAEKTVIRWDDRDRDGQVSGGDVLGYRATLTGTDRLFFFDEPRSGGRLVPGSVTTTAGTVSTGNSPGDTAVRIEIEGSPTGITDVEFDVEVVPAVENQGRLWRSDNLLNVPTDDPATPAAGDATVTPIVCSASQSCAGQLKKCESGLNACQAARQALQDQLDALLADPDADGVPASLDRCSGTPAGAAVDDRGCSLAQFCGTVDVSLPSGPALCRAADWRGDEPLRRPLDCRPSGGRCEPR